jgi:hypothetical protein
MRKLKTLGLLSAALALAGSGALAAQDTSYTRMPLPTDTSAATNAITTDSTSPPAAPVNPAIADSIADSARGDTVTNDVVPRDTTGAAVPESPYPAPGKATEEGDQGEHGGWQQSRRQGADAGEKTGWESAPTGTADSTLPGSDSLDAGADGRVSTDSASADAKADATVRPKEVQPVVPDSTQ